MPRRAAPSRAVELLTATRTNRSINRPLFDPTPRILEISLRPVPRAGRGNKTVFIHPEAMQMGLEK